MRRFLFGCLALAMWVATAAMADVPTALNFQGLLRDAAGNVVADGLYQVQFTLYDAAAGGNILWSEGANVTTSGGLFTVMLGSTNPLADSVFLAPSRYLGIAVKPDPELAPRVRLVTVPFAYRASHSDTADYAIAGGGAASGWTDLGTIVRLESNSDSVGIGTSSPSAKLEVNGGARITGKLAVGPGSTNAGAQAFVAGQDNAAAGDYAGVFAGAANLAGGHYSVVSGGNLDSASGVYATVGGGFHNFATDSASVVAGGHSNRAEGLFSVVAGGGGSVSGNGNRATGPWSAILGGRSNLASGAWSVVGGGDTNQATGARAVVAGGSDNSAVSSLCGVLGGVGNRAAGLAAAVCGGGSNEAGANYSFVGGGNINTASESYAVVGGGLDNDASGRYASVTGGHGNLAGGENSFAAGNFAQALHDGAFVWGDALPGPFSSTADNQFLIEAAGGVGINTNAPDAPLHVTGGGDVSLAGGGVFILGPTNAANIGMDQNEIMARNNGASSTLYLNNNGGDVSIGGAITANVGLGLTAPTRILHIEQNSATDPLADAWTTYSSRRWKKEIRPIEHAVAVVQQLEGVRYIWKQSEKRDIGLIAEDVGRVVPEVVTFEENGIDAVSVDYARLVAILIEAVKEQQQAIDALTRRLDGAGSQDGVAVTHLTEPKPR